VARRRWKREGKGMAAIVIPQLKAVAHVAIDRATTSAKNDTRQRITAAGLGRLAGAVGSMSSLQRRKLGGGVATGVIFARGKTDSRANQALLAYSEGASIFPTSGKRWLAFPTKAVPRRVGRGRKMTPAIYNASGLVQSIGKLVFIPVSAKEALLVARKVNVSRRTGRAKAYAGRTPRGSDRKDVVAFVLIKFTLRAQRFSQRAIMMRAQRLVPTFAAEEQASRSARAI